MTSNTEVYALRNGIVTHANKALLLAVNGGKNNNNKIYQYHHKMNNKIKYYFKYQINKISRLFY